MVGIGAALLIVRGFEFNSLLVWYSNGYGSIIWCLLGSVPRTRHRFADTIVLAA